MKTGRGEGRNHRAYLTWTHMQLTFGFTYFPRHGMALASVIVLLPWLVKPVLCRYHAVTISHNTVVGATKYRMEVSSQSMTHTTAPLKTSAQPVLSLNDLHRF